MCELQILAYELLTLTDELYSSEISVNTFYNRIRHVKYKSYISGKLENLEEFGIYHRKFI